MLTAEKVIKTILKVFCQQNEIYKNDLGNVFWIMLFEYYTY